MLLAHRSRSSWHHYSHNYHLKNKTLHGGWKDAAALARLRQDAVRACAESERVLAENGVGVNGCTGAGSMEDSAFFHDYDTRTQRFLSRLVSTRVFPFDTHATSNAMWRAVFSIFSWGSHCVEGGTAGADNVESVATQSDFQVVERNDEMYAVKYTVALNTGGAYAAVRVHEVVTRFASDPHGKAVFIWQTALDTNSSSSSGDNKEHGAAGADPVRLQILGTGYVVLHKQPGACTSSVLSSVLELHAERAPDGDAANADKVQLMKSWLALSEACMDSISLEVDKSLL